MAWTRGPLDPTRAWPLQPSGPLALEPSDGATTMFWPWPGFAPPVVPGMPGGYASPQIPPSDPWLDPNFYPPEFPGASRAPIPWFGSDVDSAGPWQAELPPWAFWPGPAPGAWPRREPDFDSGFLEPAPLPWPRPEPYPRRRPRDEVKPYQPLPYYPEYDRFVPTPLPYYFDRDYGAIVPLAQESGAEAPEGARGLLDPRHWGAAEADGARNAGFESVNRDETRPVEDLARRLGLDPEDVAQIDSAPTSRLAEILANRQLDEDTLLNVQDRLNAIIEQNRGPSGDPHEFGAALDLRAQVESASADAPFSHPASPPSTNIDRDNEFRSASADRQNDQELPAPPKAPPLLARMDSVLFRALAAAGRGLGYDTAAPYLQHYLGATGRPMELSREMIRAEPPFREGERTLEGYYENSLTEPATSRTGPYAITGSNKSINNFADRLRALKDGEQVSIGDRWDVRYPDSSKPYRGDYSPNFFLAWGNSSLSSFGDFTATRRGDTIFIDGIATHVLNDRYDFDKGKFLAEDAHLLERYGLAKPYERQGAWDRLLTGTIELKDGRLVNPKFTWKDLD